MVTIQLRDKGYKVANADDSKNTDGTLLQQFETGEHNERILERRTHLEKIDVKCVRRNEMKESREIILKSLPRPSSIDEIHSPNTPRNTPLLARNDRCSFMDCLKALQGTDLNSSCSGI